MKTSLDLLAQQVVIEDFGELNSITRYFVMVCRSNAALGCIQRFLAACRFLRCFEDFVVWHHQMRSPRHKETTGCVDAFFLQLANFVEQLEQVQHYAVADQANLAGMQNPRGNQMKDKLLTVDLHRVPGIGAPLTASDDVGVS